MKLLPGKTQFYPEKPIIYCPPNYYPDKNPAASWANKKPRQSIKLGPHKIVVEASKVSKLSKTAIIKLTGTLLRAI